MWSWYAIENGLYLCNQSLWDFQKDSPSISNAGIQLPSHLLYYQITKNTSGYWDQREGGQRTELWPVVKILINWISRNDQKLQKLHQLMLSLRPKGYSECIITSSYLHTWLKENIPFWLPRSEMIYKQWWELKFCTLMLKTKFWRPRMRSQALRVLNNVKYRLLKDTQKALNLESRSECKSAFHYSYVIQVKSLNCFELQFLFL